jgi:hypothetical protein
LKQHIFVVFPLANDVCSKDNVWSDIGPNAKCRIDDLVFWTQNAEFRKVIVFAAGTDRSHDDGLTLAQLGARYFFFEHRHCDFEWIVNHDQSDVYGTDPEIFWGVTAVLAKFPSEQFSHTFFFGTQARHLPRVKKIVNKRFPNLHTEFITTGQTKEIPRWREAVSSIKLMLGDGWLGGRVQQLRRRFSDRFDRA